MKIIKEFIFGVRVQGERLPEPKKPKERPLDPNGFHKWCRELHVSMLYDRKNPHF